MCLEDNLKKASMSRFEWYDRGEHDYQWLIKHHKKLANRYERHKEKLRLNKWYKGLLRQRAVSPTGYGPFCG